MSRKSVVKSRSEFILFCCSLVIRELSLTVFGFTFSSCFSLKFVCLCRTSCILCSSFPIHYRSPDPLQQRGYLVLVVRHIFLVSLLCYLENLYFYTLSFLFFRFFYHGCISTPLEGLLSYFDVTYLISSPFFYSFNLLTRHVRFWVYLFSISSFCFVFCHLPSPLL